MNDETAQTGSICSGDSCQLFFFLLLYLFMGFLLNEQPSGKAILEVAFAFLTLGDCCLRPEFLHQSSLLSRWDNCSMSFPQAITALRYSGDVGTTVSQG